MFIKTQHTHSSTAIRAFKTIAVIVLLLVLPFLGNTQTPFNTIGGDKTFTRTDWYTPSLWSNNVPNVNGGLVPNDKVYINGTNNSVYLHSEMNLSASNLEIHIPLSDTVIVDGFLSNTGNHVINGVLIITKDYTNANALSLGATGVIVVLGNMTNTSDINNGTVYCFGTYSGRNPATNRCFHPSPPNPTSHCEGNQADFLYS